MRQEKSVLTPDGRESGGAERWFNVIYSVQVPDGPGVGLQDQVLRRSQAGYLVHQSVLQGDPGQGSGHETPGAAFPLTSRYDTSYNNHTFATEIQFHCSNFKQMQI